jgi:hypothetical protein
MTREQMASAPELQCRGHQRVPAPLNVRTIARSKCVAHAFIERSVRYTTKTVRRRGLCRTRHSD